MNEWSVSQSVSQEVDGDKQQGKIKVPKSKSFVNNYQRDDLFCFSHRSNWSNVLFDKIVDGVEIHGANTFHVLRPAAKDISILILNRSSRTRQTFKKCEK
jgi:hypothetical protein